MKVFEICAPGMTRGQGKMIKYGIMSNILSENIIYYRVLSPDKAVWIFRNWKNFHLDITSASQARSIFDVTLAMTTPQRPNGALQMQTPDL